MSYGEIRYTGAAGERSARLRPATAPPDLTIGAAGPWVHYLGTGGSTDGQFGLYRWEMGPRPSGPMPHFHRTMSESFFILSGRVRLFDGLAWTDTAAGDYLHVPAGGVHGFRNESGAPASLLVLFAPGARREAYFEELAAIAAADRRLGDAEWADLYRRHDQYMV